MDRNTLFAAVNTKVSAMERNFLKPEDYKKMIVLDSSGEIAKYLKNNTSYGRFFEGRDLSNIHRDEIERSLNEGLINYVDKIINYFYGDYKKFFMCFYLKYEIYDLKRLARTIHIERDYNHLKKNLVFTGHYRYIDIDRLINAKSIAELIMALKDTVYFPFLFPLIDGNAGENLFRYEMSLDRAYFNILEDALKRLPDEDRKAFFESYGYNIDMVNLQWIYRGKKFYSMSPEIIFNYTLNKGSRLNYVKIKELCYAKNLEEFVQRATKTPYAFMFKGDEKQDIFMERRMNRYLYYKLKTGKRSSSLNISKVLSFLELVEFEIRDIISIVENVRYKMDYDEAVKYLVKALQ